MSKARQTLVRSNSVDGLAVSNVRMREYLRIAKCGHSDEGPSYLPQVTVPGMNGMDEYLGRSKGSFYSVRRSGTFATSLAAARAREHKQQFAKNSRGWVCDRAWSWLFGGY